MMDLKINNPNASMMSIPENEMSVETKGGH